MYLALVSSREQHFYPLHSDLFSHPFTARMLKEPQDCSGDIAAFHTLHTFLPTSMFHYIVIGVTLMTATFPIVLNFPPPLI